MLELKNVQQYLGRLASVWDFTLHTGHWLKEIYPMAEDWAVFEAVRVRGAKLIFSRELVG